MELDPESPFNPPDSVLEAYVTSMTMPRPNKPHGLSARTVRTYLCAIAHYHALEGHPDPKEGRVVLAKMLTGVKRHRGTASVPKRPITISLLKEMKQHVPTHTLEGMTHWAALCMGVHGLFRLGELLPPLKEKRHLRWAGVRWGSVDHAVIHLQTSKTDPYGKGVSVNLFATNDETCPVHALRELRRLQKEAGMAHDGDAPLFANKKGIIDKKSVIALMKRVVAKVAERLPHLGLVSKDFSGHSLRRGGATSLALRGVRESVLRMLGRWKSDAVNLYIEVPVNSFRIASRVMTMSPECYKAADLAAAGTLASTGEMVMSL